MSCGIGHRLSSDPPLLWLWHRLAATAPIRPLAQEPPYAMGVALEKTKKKKKSGICTQWNTTPPQKEPNNAICRNMDATRDSHTECEVSQKEKDK